jgi:hypothetical protein
MNLIKPFLSKIPRSLTILIGFSFLVSLQSVAQPVLPPGITARFYTTFQNANPLDSVIVSGLWDTVSTYRFPVTAAGASVRGRINSAQTSILELKPFSTLGQFKVWLDFAHIAKLEFNDTAIIQYSVDSGVTWTRLLGASCRYLGPSVSFPQPLTSGGSRFHQQSYPADWLSGGNLGAPPQASWWKQERFDLSPFVSNRADVRIRFLLKDGNNNGLGSPSPGYGWLVDSILVTSAFSEIIPPLITHTPLTGLQFNINQSFSATIRDSLGCDSTGIDTLGVHLFYRINSRPLDSVRMLRQGTTLNWLANLDSTRIADGDTVRYLIRAKDSSPLRNTKYFPPQQNLADSLITYLASMFPTVVHSAPITGYQFSPGPFVINAQMSDASGIDSAILVYSLNNGPLITRRMPNVGGINFRDTIVTVDGDSVRYYIEAVDNSPRRFRRKLPDTTAFYTFTASGPPLVEWPATFQQCDVFLGPVYNLGPFNIPVRLTDGSDIDTAYLHYKVDNGPYQMVGMSRGAAVRDTLARWNFNGTSSSSIPGGVNAPTPHRGSGTAALVNAPTGTFVLGNAATSTNNSSDSSAGATNFCWNTTQYPAVNSNTVRGVQFNVPTTSKRNVKMSFDLYYGATASRFVRLEYSLNGSTWTPYTGTGTDTANLYRANLGGNRWYNNLSADFTGISGVDNNAQFRVRLVTVFAPGTSAYAPATAGQTYAQTGSLRIDAVTISGENDSYCNWFAQVPAVSDSDTVSYYIRAFDRSVRRNLSVSPSVLNPRTFIALNGMNMPYQDGFEVNNALWSPFILTGPVANPIYNPGGWVRGAPGKSILNSAFQGSNAWTVDSLNGNYPNNAFYVLESPVFNFLNSEQSYLNFMQWRAIDSGGVTNPASAGLGDGFWLEYTRNISVPNWQKLGIFSALPNSAQTNWYNRSSISGLTTSGGWDGRNGGWTRSEIRLPDSLFKGINLGGSASKVRFRMVFRSNGTTTSNGVAVDDVQVAMPPFRDVGVQLIASNSSGTLISVPNNNYQVKGGEPFAVFVRLQNYGLRNIVDTIIPVTIRIGTFTQTTQVRLTDTLRPGAVTATALRLDSIMVAPLRWFTLSAYTMLSLDGNTTNDSTSVQMYGVPILPVPNNDNFDVLPDNWLPVTMSGSNSNPWQRGVPTGPQLNAAFSTPNVWGTILNGNPTSGQGGYVLSPLYNFRSSVNTTLKFRMNRRLGSAGSAFRISYVDELFSSWQTLGQVSDPAGVNWYNSTGTIGGIAGPAWNGNSGSSGGLADYTEHSLELPAQFNYRNNRVRFRLEFQSGFTPTEGVIVDNWSIVPPPAREVGMRQILKPVACPDSLKATDTIRVVIRNFGGDTLYSIPFNYRFDNLPPVLGTTPYLYTTPLPPASEATVTLPVMSSPLPPGTYTLKVFTQLSGDARTSNDTITRCVKAIPVNDLIIVNNIVPTSAICYPSGLRQIKFRIRNIGHSPTTSFTAGYRIDTLPPFTQNFARVIQPNAFDTIVISTPANIPNGYTTIRMFVNGGTIDPVRNNDTLAVTLFGREALSLTHFNNFERQGYAPYCDTALSNAVTDTRYTPVPAINNSPDYGLYLGTEFSGASFNTVIPLNPWADSWNGTYLSRVVFPVNTDNRSNIRIRFKLLQVAGDNAADKRISLLRVVANGRQVGPTLQPLTATAPNNPFQTIDLGMDTCYTPGDPLVIEFQSKCRYRFLPAGTGGTDRNGNFIDDLIIYNSVPNGAEVVEVLYDPPFPTANTPVTAKARIRNNANPNYTLNSVNLNLRLNGNTVQNLVVPLSLPFMKDSLYTFSNTFNLNLGSNSLCAISTLPNGLADNFPLDDTACNDAVGFPLIDTFPYCNNFDEGQPAWLTRNPVTLRSSGNSWTFGTPAKGLINGAASAPNAWYIAGDSLYKPYDSSALYTPIFQTIKDSCYLVKFKTLWMTDFFANDTTTRPLHGDGGTMEYSTDGGVKWNTFGYLDTLTNEWYNAIVQALAVFNAQQNIVGFGWSGVSPSLYVPMQQIFNTTDNAQVIFRFRFGSDYAFQGEGWSIDDFCFELLRGPCEVVSVPELQDNGLVLSQNFPNPSSEMTSIAYYLPRGGKAMLELRDLYGRPVWSRSLGLLEGGWYKENVETAALAQGLYTYSLSFEGRKLTKKLLISR